MKLPLYARKKLLWADEKRVAWVGDIPDGWQGSTRGRRLQRGEVRNHPTNAGSHIAEGGIPMTPAGDRFRIRWQRLQLPERSARPRCWSLHNGNDRSLLGL